MQGKRSDQNLERALSTFGPLFAERAKILDETDAFAHENFKILRENRLLSAMIPEAFGGQGLSYSAMCRFLSDLAQYCPSTALVLSMHQHVLASAMVNHRLGRPGQKLLENVGRNEALVITTVANDWLSSNGTAKPVAGGYEVSAQKQFVSGAAGGDVLMTSARLRADGAANEVIHFTVPMNATGVTLQGGWQAHGMRGTGSERVALDGVFVPEGAVTLRRPSTGMHPLFHVILSVAPTLIMACYVGIAERAAALALDLARSNCDDPVTLMQTSELEVRRKTVRLAHKDMVERIDDLRFEPSETSAHETLVSKAIIARETLRTCEKALEIAGGSGMLRVNEIERLLRDARAAQFHPLTAKQQPHFIGRLPLASGA